MQALLKTIRAEHAALAERIAALETMAATRPVLPVTVTMPDLREGETWVGCVIDAAGRREHIILLPGDFEGNWNDAMAWAKRIGGELPDRVEGALLFATKKGEFEEEAYWTREQHAGGADCAWCQGFGDGNQLNYHKDNELRARAVRRLAI